MTDVASGDELDIAEILLLHVKFMVSLKDESLIELTDSSGLIVDIASWHNAQVVSLLDRLESKCEYCNGTGYIEHGGMAMEDDLVEKEPCDEEIHQIIQVEKAKLEGK